MSEPTLRVELVSHCYHYSTLLRYQLSSLVQWAPEGLHLTVSVYYTEEDGPTVEALSWFGALSLPQITWNWQALPVRELCNRARGRNHAALRSQADWVWFTDADYWFTQACWAEFPRLHALQRRLIYPRHVRIQRNHALGDEAIRSGRAQSGLILARKDEFRPQLMNRAIGGIQIVRGDICRERGYLGRRPELLAPRATVHFACNREDVFFREDLGTEGYRVTLPGVYRIRHSQAGRHHPEVVH